MQIRSPKIDERKLDRDSLLQFIEQTNSNNNQQSYNWDEWSNTSDWTGVFLDNNDRVTGIDLTNGSLSGELPASLGEISCLEQLHATSNHFTGRSRVHSTEVNTTRIIRDAPSLNTYNSEQNFRIKPIFVSSS